MLHTGGRVMRFAVLLLLSLAVAPPAVAADRPLQNLLQAGRQGLLPGVEIRYWAQLERFYEERDWQLLWSDADGRPYAVRQQQLAAWIALSYEHGLDPRDYGYERLRLDPGLPGLSSEALLNDLLMSHAFILLSRDLSGSGLDLQQHDPLWRLPPKQVDIDTLLRQLARGASVDQLLRGVLPVSPEYARLVELYAVLAERAQLPYMPPALPAGLLRVGDRHSGLSSLRDWLIRQGLLNAAQSSFEDRQLYTPEVADAVRRYQQQQGLDVDGIYGPDTRAAILLGPVQKLQQARVNLARWRALPRAMGRRYLLVRTASFTLDLVEHNEVIQRHAIISGRPGRPSLSFMARLDRLVINPPWTVPFRLAVEDLLPKQQQDPTYFERLGIDVLAQQEGRWSEVAADSVDWNSLSRRNFRYLLRQRPGPNNSLGRIRFGMANPYSIFLHDTPQQSLFAARSRAFSSGCIRVQEIGQLAERLLSEEALTVALADENTRQLPLNAPMQVYLVYLTLWVDESGQPHFNHDIYGLDARLAEALGPVPELPSAQIVQMAQSLLKK